MGDLGGDIIDTRDLAKRLHELLEEQAEYEEENEEVPTDLEEEILEIEAIENEVPDFQHGATMIHENYFESYAEEFAKDIGAIQDDLHWPANHIDWEKAAEELASDYMSVEYQGSDYYVR